MHALGRTPEGISVIGGTMTGPSSETCGFNGNSMSKGVTSGRFMTRVSISMPAQAQTVA